jgi:peroxiredoxin
MKVLNCHLFIVSSFILISCSQPENPKNAFTLKGKITGLDTGIIVLSIPNDSILIHDTAIVKNGEFAFKGNIDEPRNVELNAGNDSNRISFYIDPASMNISLIKDKYNQYKLTGSKTDNESKEIDNLCNKNFKRRQSLQEIYIKNIDSLKKISNEKVKRQLLAENDSLDIKMAQAWNEDFKTWLLFIKSHSNSYISPLYIKMLWEREFISLDSAKNIFNNLDSKVKISQYGRKLSEDIKIHENTQIGAFAPDFKANDINGQSITLSQFRGKKVILIEFWASWCQPCRSGFPFLKSLYNKFNPKGFDIIAISNNDTNRKTWKFAIVQEKIENWNHLATVFLKDNPINQDILRDYPLSPIPMSFLIDRSGKIVGTWKGHTPENEKDLEIKLAELLK